MVVRLVLRVEIVLNGTLARTGILKKIATVPRLMSALGNVNLVALVATVMAITRVVVLTIFRQHVMLVAFVHAIRADSDINNDAMFMAMHCVNLYCHSLDERQPTKVFRLNETESRG